jgi:hypothetical protein
LKRQKGSKRIRVEVEHRSETSIEPFSIELVGQDNAFALCRAEDGVEDGDEVDGKQLSPRDRLLEVLGRQSVPLSMEKIVKAAGMKSKTAHAEIKAMTADGVIMRTKSGIQLRRPATEPVQLDS